MDIHALYRQETSVSEIARRAGKGAKFDWLELPDATGDCGVPIWRGLVKGSSLARSSF